MSASSFLTFREALRAMLDAGATFTVRRREDGLGPSFTYRVAADGDPQKCRRILVAVRSKPEQFSTAFRIEVERLVGGRS